MTYVIKLKRSKKSLSLMRQELQKAVERTTALEGRVSQVEDDIYPLQQEVKTIKDQLGRVIEKMDEIENRLRRDNVRVVGLPERSEGLNPIAFLEKWLIELFGRETFSPQFSIERAHRVPFKAPPPGGHRRSLLLKFLNYKDKIILLRNAREMGSTL